MAFDSLCFVFRVFFEFLHGGCPAAAGILSAPSARQGLGSPLPGWRCLGGRPLALTFFPLSLFSTPPDTFRGALFASLPRSAPFQFFLNASQGFLFVPNPRRGDKPANRRVSGEALHYH